MSIWVTSDTHLCHNNILKLERNNLVKNGYGWINTIEQYNDMIINNINLTVSESDTLYILGDFSFGGVNRISPNVKKIKCKNKILLLGNHDTCQPQQYISMGFSQVIQGPIYLPESKGRILMCHYPLKEADNNPYIAYMLHGHLHGSYLNIPKYMNVNMAMNEYRPILVDDLLKQIETKCKSRWEPWLGEWYAEHQVFNNFERSDLVLHPTGLIDLEKTKEKINAKNNMKNI